MSIALQWVITLVVLALIVIGLRVLSYKSIVTKFVFWSLALLVLVGYAGIRAIWNNQFTQSHDFGYWQGQYKQMAIDLAPTEEVKNNDQALPVGQVIQFTLQQ